MGAPTASDGPGLAVGPRVARFGEYFALSSARGPGWNSIDDLLAPTTVTELVTMTRNAVAASTRSTPHDVPVRMAASSLQMSLAARLVSPVIGAAVGTGAVPELTPDSLRWTSAGHTVRFAATGLRWRAIEQAEAAAPLIHDTLLGGVMAALIGTVQSAASLSPTVMWGNVISAANGAVTVMGMTDPGAVSAGRRLVGALARTGMLRGTAVTDGATFVRRSCCLFYQVPGGGLCGDCVLRTPRR